MSCCSTNRVPSQFWTLFAPHLRSEWTKLYLTVPLLRNKLFYHIIIMYLGFSERVSSAISGQFCGVRFSYQPLLGAPVINSVLFTNIKFVQCFLRERFISRCSSQVPPRTTFFLLQYHHGVSLHWCTCKVKGSVAWLIIKKFWHPCCEGIEKIIGDPHHKTTTQQLL